MADEQTPGANAGALEPEKEKEVSQSTQDRIQGAADAIRAARERRPEEASSKEKLIQEALEKNESAEMRLALGLDIPFNVKELLTRGVVEQRGLKIGEDFFCDMHTLTKAEDIMAERLVEEHHGPMQISKSYLEAKLVATLAIAITRINKERFPVPSTDPAERKTEEWIHAWGLKQALMRSLMNMPSGDADLISMVYANLDHADVLIEENARKKSTRP